MRRLLLAGVFSLLLAPFAIARGADEPARKLTDAEIRELIVGKWYDESFEDGTEVKGTDTFRKDGSFSGEVTFKRKGETRKLSATGTWMVVDGILIETIETCEPPILKKGEVTKDQVLSVTGKELKLEPEPGKKIVKTRIR